jgi:hypothetical protein
LPQLRWQHALSSVSGAAGGRGTDYDPPARWRRLRDSSGENVSMSQNLGAGLGDPYWYEWSVGQSYVIDMLDPASGIASVTLQKSGDKGVPVPAP